MKIYEVDVSPALLPPGLRKAKIAVDGAGAVWVHEDGMWEKTDEVLSGISVPMSDNRERGYPVRRSRTGTDRFAYSVGLVPEIGKAVYGERFKAELVEDGVLLRRSK